MAISGIMVAMTYFVILESLLPVEINVDFFHDQNQHCNHLVVQQFSITNFSSSNSVDSWSKFLSGNHREKKLLTKSNFLGPSSLSFGSSILILSLMKCGDIHPHPGPQRTRQRSTAAKTNFTQFNQFQQIIAQKTRAAVIGISETWLDDSITDAEIAISGYSVLRLDRNRLLLVYVIDHPMKTLISGITLKVVSQI